MGKTISPVNTMIRFFNNIMLLLIPLLMEAQSGSSGGLRIIAPLPVSVISEGSASENGNGQLIEMSPEYFPHRNNMTSQHRSFYQNLEQAAYQRKFTRWLHELLVKEEKVTVHSPVDGPLMGGSMYAPFEGKTIGKIDFRAVSLFASGIDDPYYSQPNWLERIGGLLHFNTNPVIIRNNLLFRQGDKVDPFTLSHNELILRQLSFIEDARIYVYEDPYLPDHVNVEVVTKDRWSRGMDMDLSEVDRGRLEFFDRNIGGLGQDLEAHLLFDGAHETPFGYRTRLNIHNLGTTFIRSGISYSDAFGNSIFTVRSGRNFLFPSMKYAGGVQFTRSRLIEDYVFPDRMLIDQRLNFYEYDMWAGRSFQLSGKDMFNRSNIYISTRFNRFIFSERPEVDENTGYDFHNRDVYLLSISWARRGFFRDNLVYGFGPSEDLPLGSKIEIIGGYENNQFFPRWYTGFSVSRSRYFQGLGYLQNNISLGGFINDGEFEQGVLNFGFSGFSALLNLNGYYLRQFFSAGFTRGFARFEDEYLSISNRNGIRGLRSDRLTGTQKFTVQTETMVYFPRNWYGFRYGFFAMVDLGWVGYDNGWFFKESFYSGLGAGIRIRNEHLVLPTIQVRLAWYPIVPEDASVRLFYLVSERRPVFGEFQPGAPDLIPYR